MTWTKLGNEFFDQLANMDFPDELDDACQLTHTQAIHYLYSVEEQALTFRKSLLPRFATSPRATEAAEILSSIGAWADRGLKYEIVHHADVIRQSIGYQLKERDRKKNDQRRRRAKAGGPSGPGGGVAQDVPQHVARYVDGTQSVSQSFSQLRQREELSDESVNTETGELGPRLKLVDQYASDDFEDYIGAHDAFEKRFSS